MYLITYFPSGGGEGAEVVYALRNNDTLAKGILESLGEAGQKMRSYYQRRLPEDRTKDYYFIQRLTGNTEPVLIEYGFIDNANDLRKLQNNLLDYGEAVVKAVANYVGVPYQLPNGTTTPSDSYIVKRGDSLYEIAAKYGITVNELKAANNLSSNLIQIGQILKIPNNNNDNIPQNGTTATYTVKRGDTLYKIAAQYNLSVNDLISANNLSSTNLTIGQQLIIPSSNIGTSLIEYTVQNNDSLWKIANLCNITVDEIVSLNNLQTTMIIPGEKLMLPSSCNIQSGGTEGDNNIEENNGDITYTVTLNDTLYSIARKYGTTVAELIEYNNLPSNVLTVGQVLLIPNTGDTINYYVQPNDTLYGIAREFNTTVEEIKRLNNLSSNTLQINQLLLIPR